MHDHAQTVPGHQESTPTRRAVMAGTGMLAVSAALAGCGSYGDSGGTSAPGQASSATAGAPPAAPSGGALASTSDVPVGGGQIFTEEKVVVTQSTPGTFRAFSAVCPHQGCTVNEVEGGTINCPCHGSKFAVTDGSVVSGPAKRPLDPQEVVVEGDQIRLA